MIWATDNTVDVLPADEHGDLRDAVRDLVGSAGDVSATRQMIDSGQRYSADLWRELSDSIAVTSMSVPETSGGLGHGLTYLCTVVEECGRALRPEPVLVSAAIGVPALIAPTSTAAADLRDDALAGRRVITTTSLTISGDHLTAEQTTDGWVVDGLANVVDAPDADVVITTAQAGSSRALFAVPVGASAELRPLTSIDPTRPQSELRCRSAEAVVLAGPDDAAETIHRLRTRAIIALAAENVGLADRLLAMTLQYTRSRRQFGREIASFQAVKHRLVDMFLDVESARSAAWYAAALLDHLSQDSGATTDTPGERLDLAAAVAGSVACDAAIRVATEAIQLHGGIGFTWEHPAHSYYRRALTNETLFGSGTEHRRRIAGLALASAASGI
ncbi:acyl-CoA dehydrogenase family protein [Williamsia sp. SKLECPSW1]